MSIHKSETSKVVIETFMNKQQKINSPSGLAISCRLVRILFPGWKYPSSCKTNHINSHRLFSTFETQSI